MFKLALHEWTDFLTPIDSPGFEPRPSRLGGGTHYQRSQRDYTPALLFLSRLFNMKVSNKWVITLSGSYIEIYVELTRDI